MAAIDSQRKISIKNTVLLILSVILLCITVLFTVFFLKNAKMHIIFGVLTGFLFLLTCVEAYIIGSKFLYYDFYTQSMNSNAVMRKAGFLLYKKKLYLYNGVYINIKEFKYFNQRFGPRSADGILIKYSKTVESFVKNHKGYFCHLGGDNFYVIIRKDEYACLLDFLKSLPIDFEYEGEKYQLYVKARAGITSLSNEINIRNIIFYSSIALTAGRGSYVDFSTFNTNMLEIYTKERQMVTDSQRALKEDEFIPYYQPKVNAKNCMLCGCEALVRWQKNGEMISPAEFIPILEKANAIYDIDFRVFELVCKDIRDWLNRGIEPVRISTNFSKLHLNNPDFVQKIIEIKNRYNIDGKYLEVELTESAGITNFAVIQQFAEQIRSAGMYVAIDDFGTGYSSLSMIQTIKADVVKMDRSFLEHCFTSDAQGKQFIIDVIAIINHQNEEVLFEGVENKAQLDFLVQNGCNIIQGFYFDKPLSHDEFEKRLINPKY